MEAVMTELQEARIGQVRTHHPLAEYTTWKIGGPADIFIVPNGEDELAKTLAILNRFSVPWFQLGRGSNLLISDKGIRGAVIKLGPAFENLSFEDDRAIAGSAYSFIKLCVIAGKRGLTGLEFAGGIPGTVGGAVYMNAGAHGSDVSRIFTSAEIVLTTGEKVIWQSEDMGFSYRHSRLQREKGVVTKVVFQLSYGERLEIAAAMATYKDRRLKTQPLQLACAGSVFRNPEGHHAARLIEASGLKGYMYGKAQVSPLHANFIVNTGQATAGDVLALITHIQETVFQKHGVRLETEVLNVGEP